MIGRAVKFGVFITMALVGVTLLFVLSRKSGLNKTMANNPSLIICAGCVKAGDTMASILGAQGFPSSVVVGVQRTFSQMLDLRRLIPGHRYEIARSTSGEFHQLAYQPDVRRPMLSRRMKRAAMLKRS